MDRKIACQRLRMAERHFFFYLTSSSWWTNGMNLWTSQVPIWKLDDPSRGVGCGNISFRMRGRRFTISTLNAPKRRTNECNCSPMNRILNELCRYACMHLRGWEVSSLLSFTPNATYVKGIISCRIRTPFRINLCPIIHPQSRNNAPERTKQRNLNQWTLVATKWGTSDDM